MSDIEKKAIELFNNKKFKDSLNLFGILLKDNPNSLQVNLLSSYCCIEMKLYEKALIFLDTIIKSNKKMPEVFYHKGICHGNLRQYGEAIISYEMAITLKKDYIEPYIQLGQLLKQISKLDEAIKVLLIALNNVKQKELINTNISEIFYIKKNYDLSIKHANEAIKDNKNNYHAVINIANCYIDLGHIEKAIRILENIAIKNKNVSMIFTNLGYSYKLLGNYDKANLNYQKAITINPNNCDAHFNLSHIKLGENNFKDGWYHYEQRWGTKKFSYKLNFEKPLWNLKLGYGRILIWAEQGIGEQILFSTILPELSSHFKKVLVAINDKLVPVFKLRFKDIEVLPVSQKVNEDKFDFHLPIGSLGKFFRKDHNSFPHTPVSSFTKEKKITNNSKPRCALSWISSNEDLKKNKSMKLNDLVDIISIKEFEFFNIQYTNEQDEVDDFFKDHGIKINNIEGVDPFNDLLGLTDFINTCDFVITVSNTNAHLAASLGIPTYLLLPLSKGKFWYWSNEKNNKNLWYPSILKFQQCKAGSWIDPVKRLKNYLEEKYQII
jgi:tetratricopeptide (TPR) repeat protein